MPILFKLQGKRGFTNQRASARGIGPLCAQRPLPTGPVLRLAGVSRDAAGAPLGGCTCTLFRVNTAPALPTYTQVAATVSDGSGNFSFAVGSDGPWRVTWDLPGAPVRAGISLPTLIGA